MILFTFPNFDMYFLILIFTFLFLILIYEQSHTLYQTNLSMRVKKIVYFLIFIISCFSWGCSNSMEQIKKVQFKEDAIVENATDVDILYSDSAVVRMRIKAPLMENRHEENRPKRTFPNGVWVDFFDKNKMPTSHMTAKYAEYVEYDKLIILRDSVVITNYKNEQLETEELFWNEKDSKIYSSKFVKVITTDEIIYGYGFNSNMEFTEWEIDSVSGVFQSGTLIDGKN